MNEKSPKFHPKTIDYDEASQAYDEVRQGDPDMVAPLLEGTQIRSDSFVLDIGCGTGNNTSLFAESTGARVVGLDLSIGMLKNAAVKCKRVEFVNAPADYLPFRPMVFDMAFMTEVVHHLPDLDAVISSIVKVLVKGGLLCIVTQSHEQIEMRMTSRFFPATIGVDQGRYPSIDTLEQYMLRNDLSKTFSKTHEFTPILLGEAYLKTVEKKGYSMLYKIPENEYEKGLAALRNAFDSGEELHYTPRYTFVWGVKGEIE